MKYIIANKIFKKNRNCNDTMIQTWKMKEEKKKRKEEYISDNILFFIAHWNIVMEISVNLSKNIKVQKY